MSDRSKFIASNGVGESEHGNDVAICGFSIKFPGDAVSAESFWHMLIEKRCAMTEFPASRFNKNGFYKQEKSLNTVQTPFLLLEWSELWFWANDTQDPG